MEYCAEYFARSFSGLSPGENHHIVGVFCRHGICVLVILLDQVGIIEEVEDG